MEVATVIEGVAVTLLDTAGERTTDDPVEAAGLALAQQLVEGADALIVVLRAKDAPLSPEEHEILKRTANQPRILVYNGVDRTNVQPAPEGAIESSAKTGLGIEAIKRSLFSVLVGEELGESASVIASVRQRDQLLQMAHCVEEAMQSFTLAGVAVAAEFVTEAIAEVDILTGEDTRERVLDAMFSRFCIGK